MDSLPLSISHTLRFPPSQMTFWTKYIQIDTTNEDQIAFDMYTFLQEFFQLYPKYNKLPFFLLGESVCINPLFSSISCFFIYIQTDLFVSSYYIIDLLVLQYAGHYVPAVAFAITQGECSISTAFA